MTTTKDAKNELWFRGVIRWKLKPHQLQIYNKIREVISTGDITKNSYVIDCSRQFGKSFIMFLIAVEECIRNPKYTVVFVGPLKSQVNEIINGNTFGVIFKDCPPSLVPKYDGSTVSFSNGSRIRLAGTDNKNYMNLRGGAAHLVLLDEAGFMADLDSGVIPTVLPMTKTTNGKIIYASTPPESLDHPYIDILREHEEQNLISTFTIWDDKGLTEEQLQRIINQCRGQHTTKFKREFECQRITETTVQVIPELNTADDLLVKEEYDELKQFWIKYVIADTGVRDKTAVIFAYYNYHTRKIMIEDYLDLQGHEYNTEKLAYMIKEKTRDLWGNDKAIRYVADSNNKIVINDLNIIYKLPFIPTSKGRLDEMCSKVRNWVYNKKILFLPNAKEVYDCARFAIWDKSKDQFARSNRFGHYDLLAALIYLIRNVDEVTNPIPGNYKFDKNTQFRSEVVTPITGSNKELYKIFGQR